MKVLLFFSLFVFFGIAHAQEEMTVQSIKTKKAIALKTIQLINPPHRSTLSDGVVTFQWDYKKKFKKKKTKLVITKAGANKKTILKVRSNKRNHYLKSGEYSWQIIDHQNKLKSRLRTFKVVEVPDAPTEL